MKQNKHDVLIKKTFCAYKSLDAFKLNRAFARNINTFIFEQIGNLICMTNASNACTITAYSIVILCW